VAIDPKFGSLVSPAYDKPATLLFQMTSDDFFASYDPTILLNGPIDMAFLDGMHLYEFLLRDFINVERSCKPNSIILLHDCIPTDAHVARRRNEDARLTAFSEHPGWWAGDVWKAALIIRRLRPDLKFFSFDAGPTGLVAITGLDPGSRVLSAAYFDIVAEYRATTLDQAGAEAFLAAMNCIPFSSAVHDLASMFWL
jgi:hypothetical protein